MATKNKKKQIESESDLDLDQDDSLEEDLKRQEQETQTETETQTDCDQDIQNIWFSDDQLAFLSQFTWARIEQYFKRNEKPKETKETKKETKKELTEEQKQRQHQKQINYYHGNIKKIQTKIRSIVKSICTKSNINKQYLACFSKENVEQIRSFVKSCQENKDHTEEMDLAFYFEKITEKYGCKFNNNEFNSIQLDHSLLC